MRLSSDWEQFQERTPQIVLNQGTAFGFGFRKRCFRMIHLVDSPAKVLLLGVWAGIFGFGACVETGNSNTTSSGGRSGIDNSSNGGSNGAAGGDVGAGGCAANVDTANDGTAGTASLGPYTWKSVTIRGGGFVDGIIFSPIKKDTVFARTDMGGAYRFDAAVNGWVPLTDWLSRNNSNWIGIESIAADPADPNVVYMAAGTYMTAGSGVILRSSDGGTTFTQNAISAPMGGNADGRSMGERLAIDPNLTSTLYFGSRANGLLRSTDSASTWSTVASFPVVGGKSSGGTQLGLSFVLFDPSSGTAGNGSSTIYVGVADVTAGSNLYVSKDAGGTWQLVDGGPSAQMPHHGVLDAAGKLYLAYNNGPGPNSITAGAVWKYDTATGEWSNISPSGISGNHGFGGISLDANSPDTVVVSTLDWWAPDEIYRSTDGGESWFPIGRGAQHNPNGAEWLRWGAPGCATPSYGGWMGDIEIDPFNSDHVMYVTGQGVWSSDNVSASSGRSWTFQARNLEQTAVTDMLASVKGAFFSCVGDIAGMRHEDLNRPSPTGMYSSPVFGNCTSIDFAASDANIVVRAGNPTSSNSGKYGAYSRDNGKTWTAFSSLPIANLTSCSNGGKLALSADGKTVLWSLRCTVPTADASIAVSAIAASSDMGATWTAVTGLPVGSSIAADRANPNKFYGYAYVNGVGTVYVSTDAGRTFAAAQNTVPFIGRGVIRAVFGVEGEVWIVASSNTSSALYHSSQSGSDFTAVANVQAAYSVGFGKPSDGQTYPALYLYGQTNGTLGFFRSDDQGANWLRINDDQHQFGTAGYIAGDENVFGRVYIGTNGRGILYGEPN